MTCRSNTEPSSDGRLWHSCAMTHVDFFSKRELQVTGLARRLVDLDKAVMRLLDHAYRVRSQGADSLTSGRQQETVLWSSLG
jgi:hypothetical protein